MGVHDLPPLRSRVVAEAHAPVTKNTSVAEETLATLAVPTNLAAGDLLRLSVAGTVLNSSGSAATFDWKVKLGATTVFDSGAPSLGSASQRRGWRLAPELLIVAPASDQRAHWWTVTIGTGTLSAGQGVGTNVAGAGVDATEDLTAAKNLVVTVTMGTSSSVIETVMNSAVLTVIRKAA